MDNMENWPRVEKREVKAFIQRCMEKLGTEPRHAEALGEVVMLADYRGHYSHGLNRLGTVYGG